METQHSFVKGYGYMKIANTQNDLLLNRIMTIAFMIIFIIIAMVYVYNHGMYIAEYSADEFYDFYFEEKSNDVKTEVETQLASIQYEWELVSDLEMSKIEHEILHLSDIMSKSYLMDIEDPKLLREETVRHYEEIINYDEEHLYFLLDVEGNLLRSGAGNVVDGTNLMDARDINGTYFARDILKAIDEPEGIYASYFWPREAGGEPKEKISFCYYIPGLNVVVGTGVYLEDIFDAVQKNVFRRLNEYYRDKENYVFVYSNSGEIMVGPTLDSIGADANAINSTDGLSVHQIFSDFLKEKDSGFVNYEFVKKGGSKNLEKVSYISRIDGWAAYIGMGFYTEDIDLVYDDFSNVSKKLHLSEIVYLGILLSVLLIIMVFFNWQSRNIQYKIFKNEESTYRVLFEQISDGVIVLVGNQIVFANGVTKKYLGDDLDKYISDGKLVFTSNPDGTIETENRDIRYYLEIITERIFFKGSEGTFYRLKNISKSYEELKEYKHLSTIDELTGLPNRRMLRLDCDQLVKDGSCDKIVGMVDLDFFKKVNDDYGHDVGDQVLSELAYVFQKRLRKEDSFYRYGGEEFVVMIHSIDLEEAVDLLMEINRTLNERILNKFGFSQTFSAGIIATKGIIDGDLDEIIRRADELLYLAKSNGRNQIQY